MPGSARGGYGIRVALWLSRCGRGPPVAGGGWPILTWRRGIATAGEPFPVPARRGTASGRDAGDVWQRCAREVKTPVTARQEDDPWTDGSQDSRDGRATRRSRSPPRSPATRSRRAWSRCAGPGPPRPDPRLEHDDRRPPRRVGAGGQEPLPRLAPGPPETSMTGIAAFWQRLTRLPNGRCGHLVACAAIDAAIAKAICGAISDGLEQGIGSGPVAKPGRIARKRIETRPRQWELVAATWVSDTILPGASESPDPLRPRESTQKLLRLAAQIAFRFGRTPGVGYRLKISADRHPQLKMLTIRLEAKDDRAIDLFLKAEPAGLARLFEAAASGRGGKPDGISDIIKMEWEIRIPGAAPSASARAAEAIRSEGIAKRAEISLLRHFARERSRNATADPSQTHVQ